MLRLVQAICLAVLVPTAAFLFIGPNILRVLWCLGLVFVWALEKAILRRDKELVQMDKYRVSFPLQITDQMRLVLETMGYTETQISEMTPQQAWEIVYE